MEFQVAKEMEKLGFQKEAEFCSAMSGYIKACDDRGYSPEERMRMMQPLYRFFLDRVMVPMFPTYGMVTPSKLNFNLAEDVLLSVQARLYLYFLTPNTG